MVIFKIYFLIRRFFIMKKILLGFFGGLFIALIVYISWTVYTVKNIESKLPPGLRQEVTDQIYLEQLNEGSKLIEAAVIEHENGNAKEKCNKFEKGRKILRNLSDYEKSRFGKEIAWDSKLEETFKKACP